MDIANPSHLASAYLAVWHATRGGVRVWASAVRRQALDEALRNVITLFATLAAHAWVVLLLVAIVLVNLYALVHAWRSDRIGWFLVILLTGGGIATAVYLIVHYDEPLPSRPSSRRRAIA
jgi:hypothetical protein